VEKTWGVYFKLGQQRWVGNSHCGVVLATRKVILKHKNGKKQSLCFIIKILLLKATHF